MKRILPLLLAILPMMAFAQGRTIKGVVTDRIDGEPVMMAIVSAKSDTHRERAVNTDMDGHFSIVVSDDERAVEITCMGYSKHEIKLKPGKNDYRVTLESDRALAEVVVTGYQKIDRRKLTAAATTVKISDEQTGAIHSIDQALAGQVAGMASIASSGSPTSPMKIRIRGTASLNGTQDPLWVLDGIPLEGTDIPSMDDLQDIDNIYQTSIAGINPSDIESITVLKDAAATAIYGARAANGVIVITTKKGKVGAPNVQFAVKLSVTPRASMSGLNLLNSSEKVDLELDLLQSGYPFRQNKGDVARIVNRYGGLTTDAMNEINALRNINTDWNSELFRTVFNQEYNLTISGGNERAHYYTSAGYYTEQGNVRGVEANRMNLTLKTDFKINKMLTVGASLFANRRVQESFLTIYGGFTNPVFYSRWANPYQRLYDEDGSYIYDVNVQGGKEDSNLDFNMAEERANTQHKNTSWNVTAIFDAELKFNDKFKITSQFGLQYDGGEITKYAAHDSYAMRKEKEASIYTYSDGRYSFLPKGGSNKVTENHSRQWTWKAMAEYNNQWGEHHNLEAMLGTEVRKTYANSLYSAVYGYDRRTLTSTPVIFPSTDYAKQFPLHEETQSENAFVSWFATASYSFMHRYTIGGSIRFDGSDVFGVAKKYRYLPLYSVSALWRIGDEKFLKGVKALDYLNLRASYGIQGNIDKQTSPYLIGVYKTAMILPGNSESIIRVDASPNPLLRWEKTQNVNVGLDQAWLGGTIQLNIDYYFRHGSDLIGMQMLPLETGFASTSINWAAMDNQGLEIALTTRNINTRDWTWTTNFNLGWNDNKVLRETVAENATYPGREGYPVGALFAYKTAGLDDQGYPLFRTADGRAVTGQEFFALNAAGASTLSAKEQRDLYTYMGSADPKVTGGFTNTIKFRKWTLGINFIFNFGAKVRVQPTYSATNFDRGLNTNHDVLNRWTPTNKNTQFPTLMSTADGRTNEYLNYSEFTTWSMLDIWIKNLSYARLQSLRLAYDFSDMKWLKRLGVRSAQMSLEGRNLFVISSNYDNYLDPETMGNPYAQPIARNIIYTLSLGF
ncbi:MAG: SusC/RagA family TonB-linked outer membrane protein [Bacteroidaceae bacterium]|nr:SusC/RagA family TonB-linked outer membrane protein [Bacteroidaceae bacterium]